MTGAQTSAVRCPGGLDANLQPRRKSAIHTVVSQCSSPKYIIRVLTMEVANAMDAVVFTPRESTMLQLLRPGCTDAEVASACSMSIEQVQAEWRAIQGKLVLLAEVSLTQATLDGH